MFDGIDKELSIMSCTAMTKLLIRIDQRLYQLKEENCLLSGELQTSYIDGLESAYASTLQCGPCTANSERADW